MYQNVSNSIMKSLNYYIYNVKNIYAYKKNKIKIYDDKKKTVKIIYCHFSAINRNRMMP